MGLTRHRALFLAFAAGLATGIGGRAAGLPLAWAGLMAADTMFLAYLGLAARRLRGLDADVLRRRAAMADEGVAVILLIVAVSVVTGVTSIFFVLNAPDVARGWAAALALGSVPLGWAMMHTVAAFHYAFLFYAPLEEGGDAGGLAFPGGAEPTGTDFLYFSFTIGMTAQVSDVAVTHPAMRRAVLLHGVAAFAYNTVILALAVNAAVVLGM